MGARGALKLANPLTPVGDAVRGTAAANMPAQAPAKPAAVEANEDLSALWDDVVGVLNKAGLVSPSDAPAIELALRHFLAARAASDQLLAEGPVEEDRKNERRMKNPAEVVYRSESLAFLEYAKQLGMTFASRARISTGEDGGANGNPFSPVG